MKGFFTKKETQGASLVNNKMPSCARCGLYKNVHSPKMEPFGKMKKGILNIGEAPGAEEDKHGRQWQGKMGKLLQRTYEKLGVDLFEDCLNINAINCRPIADGDKSNRAPKGIEIACCRSRVFDVINKHKPKLIILLGNAAVDSLITHRWKGRQKGIMTWRGWQIPDRELGIALCPTFHPSFVDRSDKNKAVRMVWERDLEEAFALVSPPSMREEANELSFLAPNHEEQFVEIIEDLSPLYKLPPLTAFDYETTGIKPDAAGHRIVCAAIATGPEHCYAFMMPKTRRERKPFLDYLANEELKKIAQNMKYEVTWSDVRMRTPVRGLVWDTMQATHILDNRPGITGLKFQVYVNFGVLDYSSEVSHYFRSVNEKDGNSLNRIFDLIERPGGKEKLLTYCGLDSLFEYKLAKIQMEVMDYGLS